MISDQLTFRWHSDFDKERCTENGEICSIWGNDETCLPDVIVKNSKEIIFVDMIISIGAILLFLFLCMFLVYLNIEIEKIYIYL